MENITIKKCSKCGKIKFLNAFSKRRNAIDNKQIWCKECMGKIGKEYLIKYRKKHHKKALAYSTKYYISNREEILKQMKDYYKKNRDKKLKYASERRKLYPQYMKEYKKSNPDVVKLYNQARYARRKKAGKLTTQTIRQIYKDNIKKYRILTCEYCKNPIKFNNDSLDHKIPLFRGGTNARENLCIACIKCNTKKHIKTNSEFIKLLCEKGGNNYGSYGISA